MSSSQASSTLIPPAITSSNPLPTIISSFPSSNQHKSECSDQCILTIALILVPILICLILLKFLCVYLSKRRTTNSVVDLENPESINHNNLFNANHRNGNLMDNHSSEVSMTNDLTRPRNAFVRNRHTISERNQLHPISDQRTLLKRTRTTISYLISNNKYKLQNHFINSLENAIMIDSNNNTSSTRQLKSIKENKVFVENGPLSPPLSISINSPLSIQHETISLDEAIKKFNRPWEFLPDAVVKEMNTIKVTNRGRIIEIDPEFWSSVVKDACVQSNYPFYVPLPSRLKNDIDVDVDDVNVLNENEKLVTESDKETLDEKDDEMDEGNQSISNRIKKKIRQKKKYQQQFVHKIPKIEEILKEYEDGDGLNYFEITVLEKEYSHTNIVIGVTTKPFPCYKLPGHTERSIGYHSNSGEVFQNSIYNGWEYGPSWNKINYTVGCGYKPLSGEIYFTLNGTDLGSLFTAEVEQDILSEKRYYLFPSIGANGKCKVRVNFGEEEFVYKDIYEKDIEEGSYKKSYDIESTSSCYSDDENTIRIKMPESDPLGMWKDVKLKTDEKVWRDTIV
ncbi:8061_t:CDS:2 [Funneliformis caledonium]|uniref:8061_t:CDS:1 n=1 Tax=Funneliformis caledonium TaxID=1117310 RepID=A0A9N8YS13_9GLOM|nr:8061_t:CDS:2 [Funneliformis caledonium]